MAEGKEGGVKKNSGPLSRERKSRQEGQKNKWEIGTQAFGECLIGSLKKELRALGHEGEAIRVLQEL